MLEKAIKQLNQLAHNAERLDGDNDVKFDELFPDSFIKKHSSYPTFQKLYDSSPFKDVEFDEIPDVDWNNYICQATNFDSWEEMMSEAGDIWLEEQLVKGV